MTAVAELMKIGQLMQLALYWFIQITLIHYSLFYSWFSVHVSERRKLTKLSGKRATYMWVVANIPWRH